VVGVVADAAAVPVVFRLAEGFCGFLCTPDDRTESVGQPPHARVFGLGPESALPVPENGGGCEDRLEPFDVAVLDHLKLHLHDDS